MRILWRFESAPRSTLVSHNSTSVTLLDALFCIPFIASTCFTSVHYDAFAVTFSEWAAKSMAAV